MRNSLETEILGRIRGALEAAVKVISSFAPGSARVYQTSGRGLVTEADLVVNQILRQVLVRDGEGWLSEESEDDLHRLKKHRVWVVDPLDGTSEFVAGVPEWCVSVGLVENGRPVAGGVRNPATGETFLGSLDSGLTYNGRRVCASQRRHLAGAVVLASRTEVKRGEWEPFQDRSLVIRPVGSVAYKLALVAAGSADATWTFTPKNEWDVAAGVALVEAAGGFVENLESFPLTFNNEITFLSGLLAGGPHLRQQLTSLIRQHKETHGYGVLVATSSERKGK